MIFEHGLFTGALAILIAMFYERYTKHDPMLVMAVVWFAMFIPDTDYLIAIGVNAVARTPLLEHGCFHNILCLAIVMIIGGWFIAKRYRDKITMVTATACITIGFVSHLVEDALVYNPAYSFLAPFSNKIWSTGWIPYPKDIIIYGVPHIGSSNVYALGIVLVAYAVVMRCAIQGTGWLSPITKLFGTTKFWWVQLTEVFR